MDRTRLITLDPGHFHAALVQKEMYPGVDEHVHVYAPLGPDLLAHLNRISSFNRRRDQPTHWQLEVHAGPDFLERMLRERPGNVVVLSGRNRQKIDRILAAVQAGFNVLADKPWVISVENLPKLEAALNLAEVKGLVAYDIMTERYEVTSVLQREFVQDVDTFGAILPGSAEKPGVLMESVHYLKKPVAGESLYRPAWFFDIHEQGEGLTDVGTHLVDLVLWILFPEQAVDHQRDIQVLAAGRWPTILTQADFTAITGENPFPDYLACYLKEGCLAYYCNTQVSYTVRGIHTKLNTLWGLEAPPGAGDTHLAVCQGTQSRIEVRQGREQGYKPEVYVVPNDAGRCKQVLAALKRKVAALQERFGGIAVVDGDSEFWVTIPGRYRTGHEAHFAEVTRRFLEYLRKPGTLPGWEKSNMLAKYYATTQGVRLANKSQ